MESTAMMEVKIQQLEMDKREAIDTIHDLRTDKQELKERAMTETREKNQLRKRLCVADKIINLTQEQRRKLCDVINESKMTIMSNNVRDMNAELLRNPEAVEMNWSKFAAAWKEVVKAKPPRKTTNKRDGITTTTFFPEERAVAANCA